ncbi:MAG TPA: M10 family metallopeptidase C-terminal domain-containing protein, partial [Vineibacter sp.]|nr:M10 family metallopeptidase C-terminal domain-containing protein [Vineibacter sp.]
MSNGADMRRRLGRRDGADESVGIGGGDQTHGAAGSEVASYLGAQSHARWTGGFEELDYSEFSPLDAINWFSADNIDVGTGGVVKVYFATSGQSFGELADNGVSPLPSFGWNAFEKQQMMLALTEFGKILGYTYVETTNSAEAEFRLITTTSTQYGAYFIPQDSAYGTRQGIGVFNVDSGNWDKPGASQFDTPGSQISLTQGGFAFAVILHELGHAHGLAHPHDTGGGSDVMLGVTSPSDLGDFDLNQGVYTVMSYNDAWQLHPDGASPFTLAGLDSGWSGTLSALDIAVLQQRYGINNPHATGNSVYTLKDAESAVGTYYETIWDTGGTDEIRYIGTRDAQIDLNAATLDYSATGGGLISFVDDIHGGYTIANGVVIENGTGGSGNDTIIGNGAANVLRGEEGNDTLVGGNGNDYLAGGGGSDVMQGDAGDDTYYLDGAGDVVNEAAGQGYDRVATTIGYTLVTGSSIEELYAEMPPAPARWTSPATSSPTSSSAITASTSCAARAATTLCPPA